MLVKLCQPLSSFGGGIVFDSLLCMVCLQHVVNKEHQVLLKRQVKGWCKKKVLVNMIYELKIS